MSHKRIRHKTKAAADVTLVKNVQSIQNKVVMWSDGTMQKHYSILDH